MTSVISSPRQARIAGPLVSLHAIGQTHLPHMMFLAFSLSLIKQLVRRDWTTMNPVVGFKMLSPGRDGICPLFLNRPSGVNGVRKLAIAGGQAGLSLDQMIQLLTAGMTLAAHSTSSLGVWTIRHHARQRGWAARLVGRHDGTPR